MPNVEIERKFLVQDPHEARKNAISHNTITQSYLTTDPAKVIRLRVYNGVSARLTIKGKSQNEGMSRPEHETDIDVKFALAAIKAFGVGTIYKIRHVIIFDNQTWELDEFLGSLQGFWLAECETSTIEAARNLVLPPWLGADVTNDHRFSNLNLGLYGFDSFSKSPESLADHLGYDQGNKV
jgi:CYTH domain-containing protein